MGKHKTKQNNVLCFGLFGGFTFFLLHFYYRQCSEDVLEFGSTLEAKIEAFRRDGYDKF